MTPAAYAPDATGVPALWPWMLALPPRDHCATVGCTGRPPKPRHGDAPAAAVWCAACRVAQAPTGPTPCAAARCSGTARPMRASRYRELEPYCPRCRHRGHVALIRRKVTRETVAAYLGGGAP